tara:strand:+ start:473 stop:640 length:168 start_codon:yes stop_codon:yes gene_type:complete
MARRSPYSDDPKTEEAFLISFAFCTFITTAIIALALAGQSEQGIWESWLSGTISF